MATLARPLRDLFRDVKAKKSFIEIAREAGIEGKAPVQMVTDALNRNDGLSYKLADYILSQTVFAGDPLDRASTNLAAAGLSPRELENVRNIVLDILGKRPVGTTIAKDVYESPASTASEPEAVYPEKKIKPINRRDELAVFPVAKKGARGAVPIESWENLAAGFGEDLAKGELTYIRELPDWRGVHSLFVCGDSMEQTLHDGDLILVQQFANPNGYLDLQPKGEGPKNSRAQLEQFVPNDKLFVLAIGEGAGDEFHIISGPTIKRVRYQGGTDWELFIDADNPLVWPSQKVRSKHSVRFYARVMGLGDGKYTKQYSKG